MDDETSLREKRRALRSVVAYRPAKMALAIALSVLVAVLEGVGVGFLLPLLERSGSTGIDSVGGERLTSVFRQLYRTLGVPFELEYLLAGIAVVLAVRYAAAFAVAWLSVTIQINFVRQLQVEAFENALGADVELFEEEGSERILNTIITQAPYSGEIVEWVIRIIQQSLLGLVYAAIAFSLAPALVATTATVFLLLILGIRRALESGHDLGSRVATADERIQKTTQAGVQGVREVKIFNLDDELASNFREAIDQYADSTIALGTNQAAMGKVYQFSTAAFVLVLIYLSRAHFSLSLGSLGVVLFSVYRLAPMLNAVNNLSYEIAAALPHLVRTRAFVEDLKRRTERDRATAQPPESVDEIVYEDVSFSYDGDPVLRDVSLSVGSDEFVAFVGPSGAGKSTIVSLLARLYDPDSGRITADGTPIDEFPLDEWRSRVSAVRQDPYVFNETLRYNVAVGNRDASPAAVERACATSGVTSFLDELPNAYDTVLGDDGVRLSGGQRQCVAIARALLKDADVLVLDEATSEMDASLESDVLAGIRSADDDRAEIVIAHRLATVTDADKIYLIEDGEIVGRGSHELLLNGNDEYVDFYSSWDS